MTRRRQTCQNRRSKLDTVSATRWSRPSHRRLMGSGAPTAGRAVEPDFDGDGYADLAIGVPFERRNGIRSGAVHVLYGSARGLSAARDQVWTQDSPGVPDRSEPRDNFGWSIATGRLRRRRLHRPRGRRPTRDGPGARNAGAVTVLYGSPAGLVGRAGQFWHQDRAGVPDQAEVGDQYGWSMVAGDFDGDGDRRPGRRNPLRGPAVPVDAASVRTPEP